MPRPPAGRGGADEGSSADLAKAVSWTEQDGSDQLWTVRRIN